jgi:O-acetyl-ADP-ribose deacetylase (regulator of RNase III)
LYPPRPERSGWKSSSPTSPRSRSAPSSTLSAISTGVYRFPADLAARIAVETVASELSADARGIQRVAFCCFSEESAKHHMNAFAELGIA